MALTPGSKVGSYEVLSLLGAGGMGEVYRARDPRLNRDVAVKVLSGAVGPDRDHVARFEREARTLAALNHANIAAIHGVQELPRHSPDTPPQYALILELVEGETLAERIGRGPLPISDALDVAEQVADALEAAHEKGIIHRDLKPSNVKVTPGGAVKVLDFGLAKIAAADASDPVSTRTAGLTGTAVLVGTPAYMAPEQAQGKPVDRRTDVWAFGVLLYEMLTGQRPFRGQSVHETLAAVLTSEPDWRNIPESLRPLLHRCLERNPRQRLRDIGDFRFLIREPASNATAGRWSRPWLLAFVSTVLGAAVALAAWGWVRPQSMPAGDPVRLTTMVPPGVSVTRGPGFASSVALSPDGRTLVIAATDKDGQRLYRRRLDAFDAAPLAGTDRGSSPFFSPDGEWIGFFADGRLKRVPAAGGAAVDITPVSGFPAGASWGADDRIVFATGPFRELQIVDSRGEQLEPVKGVTSAYHPSVLPGRSRLLFESGGWIHVLDRATGRQTRLVQGTTPRYAGGHLIFSRGTTLLAAPMDVAAPALTGAAVPVVEHVAFEITTGMPRHLAVSDTGTLAYVPSAGAYVLALVEGDGTEHAMTGTEGVPENPQFSPDGRRLVVTTTRRDGEPADLWVHDLQTGGTPTRLTFDGGRSPVWMPDGVTLTYSHLGKESGIYTRRVDGRGDPQRLLALDAFHWLVGWTPDRRTLAYGVMEGNESSIHALTEGRTRRVVPGGSTWGGRLSRDGRWLAYYSLDSGTFEVYVTPFPDGGSRWLIAQGTDPAWSPDGSDVYYRSGARLMAARLDTSEGARVLSHRVVVEPFLPPAFDDYDIHPDGRRLVMVRPAGPTQAREVALVLNWFTELRRLVGKS